MLRNVLLRASQNDWLEERLPRLWFTRAAVRRFIPGEDLDAALAAAGELGERRIATVLTVLGENVEKAEGGGRRRRPLRRGAGPHRPVGARHRDLDQADAARAGPGHGRDGGAAGAARGGRRVARHRGLDRHGSSAYTDRTLELIARRARATPTSVSASRRTCRGCRGTWTCCQRRRDPPGQGRVPRAAELWFQSRRDVETSAWPTGCAGEAQRGDGLRMRPHARRAVVRRVTEMARTVEVPTDASMRMLYGIRTPDQERLASRATGCGC